MFTAPIRPSWSKAEENYKLYYKEELELRLVELNSPHVDCADSMCQDETHVNDNDSFFLDILCSIVPQFQKQGFVEEVEILGKQEEQEYLAGEKC